MLPWILLLILAGVVAYALMPSGDLVIRVEAGGKVSITGKVTAHAAREIEEFCAKHIADAGRLRIAVCYPRSNRPMQVRIRGGITQGEQQMIRNFLTTLL